MWRRSAGVTPEEWQKVRHILESALEMDSAYRLAFLDETCADAGSSPAWEFARADNRAAEPPGWYPAPVR
jgi:hypothetical protein